MFTQVKHAYNNYISHYKYNINHCYYKINSIESRLKHNKNIVFRVNYYEKILEKLELFHSNLLKEVEPKFKTEASHINFNTSQHIKSKINYHKTFLTSNKKSLQFNTKRLETTKQDLESFKYRINNYPISIKAFKDLFQKEHDFYKNEYKNREIIPKIVQGKIRKFTRLINNCDRLINLKIEN